MFGFGTAGKPRPDPGKVVGLDLTATRLHAVVSAAGRQRPLPLVGATDPRGHELPLTLHLGGRVPEVGGAAAAVGRKSPHLVCAGFLPQLGQPTLWQQGRIRVTPEEALTAVFAAAAPAVAGESDAAELALPSYLTAAQVRAAGECVAKARLPVRGTCVAALAVVAHRAEQLTAADHPGDATDAEWVVPLPRRRDGPLSVVVVDADDHALSASVLAVEADAVKLAASGAWPRGSSRLWKERLLEAMADRCVRLCRRDPRDSADADQALYDQIDPALDRVRAGLPVALTVRSAHWYQDLVHPPGEFEAFCAPLAAPAAEAVFALVRGAGLPLPPTAVWLTHAAARLPGLAAAVHRTSPESASVQALPPSAAAEAAAALALRRLAGRVGGGFLDSVVPREPAAGRAAPARPREARP